MGPLDFLGFRISSGRKSNVWDHGIDFKLPKMTFLSPNSDSEVNEVFRFWRILGEETRQLRSQESGVRTVERGKTFLASWALHHDRA
jgi:predicted esterase